MSTFRRRASSLVLLLLTSGPAGAQDRARTAPPSAAVVVSEIPPADCGGSSRTAPISGVVRGVAVSTHRVAIYAFDCLGVWWVQPSEAVPLTTIAPDGRWEAFVHLGRQYAVLVVPASFRPATKTITLPEVGPQVLAMRTVRGAQPATGAPSASRGVASQAAPQQPPPTTTERLVMEGGRLSSGFDMGVNSSRGRADWATIASGSMSMAYPAGQDWGAVFVTVGVPRSTDRPGQDFSGFRTLVVEMRGQRGGEVVELGLKDSGDPDDGTESKVRVTLQADWQRVEIPLTSFRTADLKRLYVVTEFVFAGLEPATVSVRRISFVR